MEQEQWKTTQEIAEYLQMQPQMVRKMAIAKIIPCVELGFGKKKHRRFQPSQVEAAMQKLQTEAR